MPGSVCSVKNTITIIDETVILRYLLNDDAQQSMQAKKVIETGQAFSSPEMIARVAVVLRDVYRVPRSLIGNTLITLLEDITVAEEDVLRLACRHFATTFLDFTDCLLLARNIIYECDVLSFDKLIRKKSF